MKCKKLIVFSLALSMLISLTACSPKEKDKPSKASSTSVDAENTDKTSSKETENGYTLPFGNGETIKIITQASPASKKNLSDILPLWKKYEEETGVKLDWQVFSPDYTTSMKTLLASGDVDADLIQVPGDYSMYIEAGIFKELDNAIADNAPNIQKFLHEDRPEIRKMSAYDGKTYLLPANAAIADASSNGYVSDFIVVPLVRGDIVKEYGIQPPKTMTDIYEYLSRFKKENPDKYPWAPRSGFDVGYGIYGLASSYGVNIGSGNNESFYVEDEKVVYQWTKEGMRDYVTEINKWYDEGLINPALTGWKDIETATAEIMSGNAILVTGWPSEIPAYGWSTVGKNGEGYFEPIKMPTGPSGKSAGVVYAAYGPMGGYCAIPATSTKAELVLKFLDYAMFSDFGKVRYYFGLEGETYELVDGNPQIKPDLLKNPDWQSQLFDFGCQANMLPSVAEGKYVSMFVRTAYTGERMGQIPEMIDSLVTDFVPPYTRAMMTSAETDAYQRTFNDINTYTSEKMAQFITGAEPISKWDDYVKQVNDMGLSKLIEIEQARYERYKNS